MEIKLETGLSKKLSYDIGKYTVEGGILEDKPRKAPKFGEYKTYAGKRLLKEGKASKGAKMAEVAKYLDERYNWLKEPFLRKNNKEVVQVINDIAKDLNGVGDKQRILNGFQAVIRNPILRGEYGSVSEKWAKRKGFEDALFMTGQFFKNIKTRFVK